MPNVTVKTLVEQTNGLTKLKTFGKLSHFALPYICDYEVSVFAF